MKSGWVLSLQNGVKVIFTEEAYLKKDKVLTIPIEVEEHWFDLKKAEKAYPMASVITKVY